MDIQRLKQLKILVIGDSCEDVYHFGKCEKLSPEAPVPIFKLVRSEQVGGMAKNVLNNLIGLSCSAALITNKEKIYKERFIDEVSFQHIVRVDKGESKKIDELKISEIEKINFSLFSGVIISDYDKGFISKENAAYLSRLCFENNVPLFVDSKKNDLSCFSHAIVKINQVEYEGLIKKPIESELVITRGPQGATWKGKKFNAAQIEIDHLTINENYENLRNANVCGAGDTFLSGLVVHYVLNKDLSKAILFANQCGGIAINNFGTHAITLEEVLRYYDVCI